MEILFLDRVEESIWSAMLRPRAKVGGKLVCPGGLGCEVIERKEAGIWILKCHGNSIENVIAQFGQMPLPPYIKRGPNDDRHKMDRERYQTIYARQGGAIAAPTAGLHLTEGILDTMRQKGVDVAEIFLKVGIGTFKPVVTEEVDAHIMLPESYQISPEVVSKIERAQHNRNRVVAVGTTVVRALETFARTGESEGESKLFIHPGFVFKVVQGLLTNFHIPRSTPLLLVSALLHQPNEQPRESINRLVAMYRIAIEKGYRFYSYGDAMFLWGKSSSN